MVGGWIVLVIRAIQSGKIRFINRCEGTQRAWKVSQDGKSMQSIAINRLLDLAIWERE